MRNVGRARATKLVCTLGPASAGLIPDLVAAGMDVARINLSHGDRAQHEGLLTAVREAAASAGRSIGVMADLPGPKVRLGSIRGDEAVLEEGAEFVLRASEGTGSRSGASTSHPGLSEDLREGDPVLIADGAVELRVTKVDGPEVVTEVVRGGVVRSRAGLSVPAERLSLTAITEEDGEGLEWAVRAGVDLVAQSFVRRAEDVSALKSMIGDGAPMVVAKMETRSAIEDAERILEETDAVMVARGDLGLQMALEEIPVVQKGLIARAIDARVPVIVATQMLESMTTASRPTRAEVSDVAGAVFDGADAIMLSGETAIGTYPVEAARTAARIAEVSESRGARFVTRRQSSGEISDAWAIAEAADRVAEAGNVTGISCYTRTGRTAMLLSAIRPTVPVFAFSPDVGVLRRLALFRSVVPLTAETPANTDAMIAFMEESLRDAGLVPVGEPVVMVASSPFGTTTNFLKIHRIGETA